MYMYLLVTTSESDIDHNSEYPMLVLLFLFHVKSLVKQNSYSL